MPNAQPTPIAVDASELSPLPQGYTVDQQPSTAASALPSGYAVDPVPVDPMELSSEPPTAVAQKTAPATTVSRGNPITPAPGESFQDTMNRAIQAGKNVKPEDTKVTGKDVAEAAAVTAAAPAIGFAGAAGTALLGHVMEFLGVGNEAKAAQTAAQPAEQATQKVGTGIMDQYGQEIFKDVPMEAKQQAAKIIQHPVVQKAIKSVLRKVIVDSLGTLGGAEAGKYVAGEPGAIAGGVAGGIATHELSNAALKWLLSE